MHTFVHSITFIQYNYPSPFAEAYLHFLIACLLSGETPLCGTEPRIELRPALEQANVLPTEPRRTIKPCRTISDTDDYKGFSDLPSILRVKKAKIDAPSRYKNVDH